MVSLYSSSHIYNYQITISGWRFIDHFKTCRISTKNVHSTLIRRECNPQRIQQESYYRLSSAAATSVGDYEDCDSMINYVSIRHYFALTCFQANSISCRNIFHQINK